MAKKAIFSPGPSYFNSDVRKYAGWVRILDLMKAALEQLGFEIFMPEVDPALIDSQTTVSKITSWDLGAADQLPLDADLFLGPPGYSLAQIQRLRAYRAFGEEQVQVMGTLPEAFTPAWTRPKIVTYVWNNADWWRDQQLAEEYKRFGQPYDLSPTWRWINKRALELSDRVIACSPFVKKTHAKLVSENKISIAFWGVDSERFTPDWGWQESNKGRLRVLFVGGDPVRKGLIYLVAAMRDLEGVDLYTAGYDPRGVPVDLGSVPYHAYGMVPHERMPEIMRQAHVICIPTLEDGIACSIQEGMASGLVPITSPDAAEVFTIWEGWRVKWRDVDQIRHVIKRLEDEPRRQAEMAVAARLRAETQTWTSFQEQFEAIVQGEVSG